MTIKDFCKIANRNLVVEITSVIGAEFDLHDYLGGVTCIPQEYMSKKVYRLDNNDNILRIVC